MREPRQYSARVITRMSELFVRTLRDDPVDAEVPSHRWLVRAGYIRRAAPGIYSYLPLGYRVLRRVEQIVREEMDAIGAQEVHFPALLPKEPYRSSGRWTDYGESIFRLRDRKGAERSEELTSELQSRLHLVCRLLLEKKKKINNKRKS